MYNIDIINGPNLNLLGKREPSLYGAQTLFEIETQCHITADAHDMKVNFVQTNGEGTLVEQIQVAAAASGVIINAGAYTHTSIAIHDALRMLSTPIIEVHLSNIFAREDFRAHSYISPLAQGIICGFGGDVYDLAIIALARILKLNDGGKDAKNN